MAVKLHRCGGMWVKIDAHPCWKVQKALDESGVEYEIVKHPSFPRSKRADYIKLTGTNLLPAIELEDGTVVRRESIRARRDDPFREAPGRDRAPRLTRRRAVVAASHGLGLGRSVARSSSPTFTRNGHHFRMARVLVVDDEPAVRRALERALQARELRRGAGRRTARRRSTRSRSVPPTL